MAKIAVKKGKIAPSADVLPRYLQGSQFTPSRLRRVGGSGGGAKKKGKTKMAKPIATHDGAITDEMGWVIR